MVDTGDLLLDTLDQLLGPDDPQDSLIAVHHRRGKVPPLGQFRGRVFTFIETVHREYVSPNHVVEVRRA